MTTGRINQVATTRFSLLVPDFFFFRQPHEVRRWVWNVRLRPCISFAIVLYHWSVPAPAPLELLVQLRAPPEKRPLLCQRLEVRTSARSTAELRYRHELLHYETVNGQPTIRTTPQRYGRPHKKRAALDVKAKKRNTNPKVCESKNCPAPPGQTANAVLNQRGYKAEERN